MANQSRLKGRVFFFTLTRLLTDTTFRIVYAFLPVLARGVGVPIESLARVLAVRNGLGAFGPLLATQIDRMSRKRMMLIALVIFIASLSVAALWPTFPGLIIALIGGALGKYLFDPSVQAYIGDNIPYQERGRVIGTVELGWPLSFVIGMPVAAWLIARYTWFAPFPVIAVGGVIMWIVLWRALPADDPPEETSASFFSGIQTAAKNPVVLAAIAVNITIALGNELVNLSYAPWLEQTYAVEITGLGLTAAVIGGAELSASGGVIALVDKLGIRRSMAIGLVFIVISVLALPFIGQISLTAALAGLFFYYSAFEFALVSSFTLFTELVPEARATVVGGNIAAISIGRMVGALVAQPIFDLPGLAMMPIGVAVAVTNGIGLVILLAFVHVQSGGTSS